MGVLGEARARLNFFRIRPDKPARGACNQQPIYLHTLCMRGNENGCGRTYATGTFAMLASALWIGGTAAAASAVRQMGVCTSPSATGRPLVEGSTVR